MPKFIFKVPEMNCEHCKMQIEKNINKINGVNKVEVDINNKLVKVNGNITKDKIITAINNAGYEVSGK